MTAHPTSRVPSRADSFDVERIRTIRLVAESAENGWFVGDDELAVAWTGAGTITANGLVSARPDVPAAEFEALRARLGTDRDFRIAQVGATPTEDQARWAADRGLENTAELPTMSTTLEDEVAEPPATRAVRRADRSHIDGIQRCMAISFGLGENVASTAPFANESFLARPEVSAFVVTDEDGQVVSTGMSVQTSATVVGLYAIGTLPEHQRQGHGAAVTWALMHAAREQGAEVAYLQASDEGAPVYERLGFETVATRTYLF